MTSWKSHHGHLGNVAPLEDDAKDLSWKPGGSGADAKARAKELRKYAEQRGMLREIEREKTKEKKTQASPRASETAAVATARMAEHEAEMLEQKKKRDAKDAKLSRFNAGSKRRWNRTGRPSWMMDAQTRPVRSDPSVAFLHRGSALAARGASSATRRQQR